MPTSMPDIANHTTAKTEGKLDWVGMNNIEMPLVLASKDEAQQRVSANIDAYVNLKEPQAKGIHMSRLYLLLDELSNNGIFTPSALANLLNAFVTSHSDLSDNAQVSIAFDYHLRRKSLVSGKQGWKAYPVVITGSVYQGELTIELAIEVRYSSTCPCSAALSRQLIQKAFSEKFANESSIDKTTMHEWLGTTEGIVATPHSQRSVAEVKVKLNDKTSEFPITSLLNLIENALKTPVQAAVKREDEQEFALLNGQNLMFCEDAARHLQHAMLHTNNFDDFWLKINHLESLHAHDAVSITTKGIVGGYQP